MPNYKIDKNIPMPTHGNERYPFAQMKVGDSFFIKSKDYRDSRTLYTGARRHKIKITCRKENGGIRVWRKA